RWSRTPYPDTPRGEPYPRLSGRRAALASRSMARFATAGRWNGPRARRQRAVAAPDPDGHALALGRVLLHRGVWRRFDDGYGLHESAGQRAGTAHGAVRTHQ